MAFTGTSIREAVKEIGRNNYLIPAFQREYVWEPEQIEELFVSIMKNFPISSMLFWKIEKENRNICRFYEFLQNYKEGEVNEQIHEKNYDDSDFIAVIDGQQRLTSMYLALSGSYEIKVRGSKFKKCSFYFNVSGDRREYEFKWIDDDETKDKIHNNAYEKDGNKWFQTKNYLNYIDNDGSFDMDRAEQDGFNRKEQDKLNKFIDKLCDKNIINYYKIEEQDSNRAVEIFTKINSGGKALEYADILFSYIVASWRDDFKNDAEDLIKNINSNYRFKISRDFILKSFLFLFHSDIKYNLKSFDIDFIQNTLKPNWENIKECYKSIFKMLSNINFSSDTISALNLMQPIIYFVYHKKIDINSVNQKENREKIRLWILRAIAWRAFSQSSDTVLSSMRRAFVDTAKIKEKIYFDNDKISDFPMAEIEKSVGYVNNFEDDDYKAMLSYQKNDSKATLILYMLYPSLSLGNKKFHKDHMHPESLCKKEINNKKKQWNSVVNLQLLEGGDNESKNDKPLDKWIENEKKGKQEKEIKNLYKDNYIPENISLDISHFDEFYEKRQELLINKLKEILNKEN